jgi:predicted alpha/beta hydrolase family esterase
MRTGPIALIIPGLLGSGPDHWQTRWCRERRDCRHVDLGNWDHPSRLLWMSRLDRAIASTPGTVILVAHSLGCHAVAWWLADAPAARVDKVLGALLVAPPDVDHPDVDPRLLAFAPTPAVRLPFRSLLVASRNDHYASFDRSAWMARQWGSDVVDVGRKGHINADSNLGDWPEGQLLLDRIAGRISGVSPARTDPPLADGRSRAPGRYR